MRQGRQRLSIRYPIAPFELMAYPHSPRQTADAPVQLCKTTMPKLQYKELAYM